MRILQVGPIPLEQGGKTQGGVATHLWSLTDHAAKQGHVIAVLTDNYFSMKDTPDLRDGIQIFGIRNLRRSIRTAYLFCPSFWLKLIQVKIHFGSLRSWKEILSGLLNYHRIIKEFRPEVIHIHHLENRFPFVYFLVGKSIPIITTVHSTSYIDFSPPGKTEDRRRFIRRNLDLSRNLIFVSGFLRNRYEELFPGILRDKNSTIVHNPVDDSIFFPISKEKARKELDLDFDGSVILFVGNLIPQKGLDILLDAARILKSRVTNFKILVVGRGTQQAELLEKGMENGLDGQLHFEGSKSQKELFLYYNAADIMALPSKMESFGLVFVEAMLCGCPVLGRAEVLNEILPSERCGERIPDSSPEVWTDRIEEALGRSWSKDAIHKASQGYTWDSLGDEFLKIYEEIKE